MSLERIGIAGVGLIGGSIALRARDAGAWVIGYDCDEATLAQAFTRGALDARAASLSALAEQCSTLIIALPVDATGVALRSLIGFAGPALIMDVASVKQPFVNAAARIPAYVGTHPMAGREQGGISAAAAGLFEQATWAHMPHANPALVARTRAFIRQMGAVPFEIDAALHDGMVALTSHLPQVLSVLLGAQLAGAADVDRRILELCGPGMLSMLRLARSPAALWLPILRANAVPLAAQLRSTARSLEATAATLEAGESGPVVSYFEVAAAAAGALEERIGSRPRSSADSSPQSLLNSTRPSAR